MLLATFISSPTKRRVRSFLERMLVLATIHTGEKMKSSESRALIRHFKSTNDIKDEYVRPPLPSSSSSSSLSSEELDFLSFSSLNDFFIRRLLPGARPIHPAIVKNSKDVVISSCADSYLVAFPSLSLSSSLWIKGKEFSLGKCVGKIPTMVDPVVYFSDPTIFINRLQPGDYHRLHCPVEETRVLSSTSIPGTYFTVNNVAVSNEEIDVFGGNNRVVLHCTSPSVGDYIIVFVGAALVGSCVVTCPISSSPSPLHRGEELGFFQYGGSSVLMIFKNGIVKIDEDVEENSKKKIEVIVKMGEKIGEVVDLS